MSSVVLSILTPSVWSRMDQCMALKNKIEKQISENDTEHKIEHLVLFDNRVMSIGRKREALVQSASGKYVAFVDDDDDISDDYIKEFLVACENDSDVITFNQKAVIDGIPSVVEFRLNNPDEQWSPDSTIKRGVWHVCFCRRELVNGCSFPDNNYGEDFSWIVKSRKNFKTETIVDKVLHEYIFNSQTTLAK